MRHFLRIALLAGLATSVVQPVAAQASGAADYAAGRAAFERKEFGKAAEAFERAVAAGPNNADYHLWLGNAWANIALASNMFTQARLAPRVRDEWERAVALDPRGWDAYDNLVQFYLQAPGIMGGGVDKARATAIRLEHVDPYRGGLLAASVERAAKNPSGALAQYVALMRAYPDSTTPVANAAAAYADLKQYAYAFQILDRMIARAPTDPALQFYLGRTAALSGEQLDRGASALRNVLATRTPAAAPFQAGAHFRLGMIAERRGDKPTARAEYEAAIAANPNLKDARDALKRLG